MDDHFSPGPANDNKGSGEFREFGEFPDGSQKLSVVCELTLLTNNQGLATKVIEFDKAGKLQKVSAADIYEGQSKRSGGHPRVLSDHEEGRSLTGGQW